MKDVYQILNELKIKFEKYDHPAVFTAEDADKHYVGLDAGTSKNLFLRNKKGDEHYLVIIESSKKADIKALENLIGTDKLSFASEERMMKYLGLTPGSVSPFGLINDSKKEVNIVIDNDLIKDERLAFHPNVNTATLVISTEDFKKFLEWTGNKVMYLDL